MTPAPGPGAAYRRPRGRPWTIEFEACQGGPVTSIFEASGGTQAFLQLAEAWHRRCLQDPVVSHAFSHPGQHPQHVERLAAYWAEALGGPPTYSASMGDESYVVRMHLGNGEHQEMDDRAQSCFAGALDDAGFPDDGRLRTALQDYFRWATAAMSAFPGSADEVPSGLTVPRWSWDGPVRASSGSDD